jgi:hypothetical protein
MFRHSFGLTARILIVLGLALLPLAYSHAEDPAEPTEPALPQAAATPAPPKGPSWCLLTEGATCQVATQNIGFSIQDGTTGPVLMFYVVENSQFVRHGSIIVASDLEQEIQFETASEQDAQQILMELSGRTDVVYHLPPNSETLLREVGFSLDTHLTPEDDIDMLKVHLQLILGVGPVTASYLVHQLGVAVVANSAPAKETRTTGQDVAPQAPAQVPAPSPAQAPVPPASQDHSADRPSDQPADQPSADDPSNLLPIPEVVPAERLFILPDELRSLYCSQS